MADSVRQDLADLSGQTGAPCRGPVGSIVMEVALAPIVSLLFGLSAGL